MRVRTTLIAAILLGMLLAKGTIAGQDKKPLSAQELAERTTHRRAIEPGLPGRQGAAGAARLAGAVALPQLPAR